jgi:predicted phosphodiesterase
MTIALFSDIHANLPALEACLADIDRRQPDQIFCLGDLVGYNIWPNEVIREIRRRGIPTIAGNYDFGIGRSSDDCGCAYKTDEEKANGAVSIGFTNQIVGTAERQYLRELPRHIRLELELQDGEPFQVLLVHGSPRRINEYLFEDREEKSLLRILEGANADVLCFGHTHKPYHRQLPAGTPEEPRIRHAVNIGSVGKPKDGDPRGGYLLLHWDPTLTPSQPGGLRVEFVRFEYDVEKAAKAVEDSPLPDAYARALRAAT